MLPLLSSNWQLNHALRLQRGENEGYRKGAGTIERDNRTLYINYEGAGSYDLPKIRALFETNFSVWCVFACMGAGVKATEGIVMDI